MIGTIIPNNDNNYNSSSTPIVMTDGNSQCADDDHKLVPFECKDDVKDATIMIPLLTTIVQ